jgi:hypothetical protein
LNSGNILAAISQYIKGFETIQSHINEELIVNQQGNPVNVGIELYNSLSTLFNEISIYPAVANVKMKSLEPGNTQLDFYVLYKNIPLKDMKLKPAFTKGSGNISITENTGSEGIGKLYIHTVTSRISNQAIQVDLDLQPFASFKIIIYEDALRRFSNNSPQGLVKIEVEANSLLACFQNTGANEPVLEKAIRSGLTNKFFTVTQEASKADVIIDIKSSIKKGGVIKGNMYNSNEYFSTVEILIKEKASGKILLNYSLNEHRTLSPESSTDSAAKSAAAKDVMRKVDKELKKELENISFLQ